MPASGGGLGALGGLALAGLEVPALGVLVSGATGEAALDIKAIAIMIMYCCSSVIDSNALGLVPDIAQRDRNAKGRSKRTSLDS